MNLIRVFGLLVIALPGSVASQDAPLKPSDGIQGVCDAMQHYPVVAVSEIHHNVQIHEFLRQLISASCFTDQSPTIAVEFGNSLYQPILNRYIEGENVRPEELRKVWRYTTQFMVWDDPLYERFFLIVRTLNQSLALDKQIRVLVADPPVDWAKVKTKADFHPYADRDTFAGNLIIREVLAQHKRVLLIMGGIHLGHVDPLQRARTKPASPGVVQVIDKSYPQQTLVISTAGGSNPAASDLKFWKAFTIATVRGTEIGARSFPHEDVTLLRKVNGETVPYQPKDTDWSKTEDVVDAILYLGPTSTESRADPQTYADQEYVRDLRFRAQILQQVYGFDFMPELDEVLKNLTKIR